MKIDAHLHVNFNGILERDIISYLDKNRFDYCWLMTWEEVNPGNWWYENLTVEKVWEVYIRHSSRIIPMYAPDPARDDAPEQLLKWFQKGIKGCAELKTTHRWSSKNLMSLLETVSKLRIPLTFHMEESSEIFRPLETDNLASKIIIRFINKARLIGNGKIISILLSRNSPFKTFIEKRTFQCPGYLVDLENLNNLLSRFPGVKFIGHGPFFWKHISGNAVPREPFHPKGPVVNGGISCKLLKEYKNFYADISGYSGFNALNRDKEFTRKFLHENSNKLLFGTDNEISLRHEELIKSLNLSTQAQKKIMGENALSLLSEK